LHQGEVISLQLGDGRVQIIPGKRSHDLQRAMKPSLKTFSGS
jgi:hypothetical protein